MSDSCLNCGGLIMEPNKTYGYAGPVCYCPKYPRHQYQRPASKEKSMNPPPPIPAPEGEVPPRVRECYSRSMLVKHFYEVGSEEFERTPEEMRGREFLSLAEHEQLLSAETQRGLRAVEEVRAETLQQMAEYFDRYADDRAASGLVQDNSGIRFCALHLLDMVRTMKAQASRAAKEPS